jgi:hypothetical protein
MWMTQLGIEKEGVYFAGFNVVKSKDQINSLTSFPLPPNNPQENFVVSFLSNVTTEDGWTYHLELGQSFYTKDVNAPLSLTPINDLKPFITSNTSTGKDNAVMLGVDKKGKDWLIGAKFNYYGAGYYTAGYQFMANDKMEFLANTRFNAWKNKINVVASFGERLGNLSRISGPSQTTQIIANVNVLTQFTDRFSLNTNFNNFGFDAPSFAGYKSVNNELSFNPTYTWSNSKMNNLISGTYTRSVYDETTVIPVSTTHNTTQTALLLYVPTYFESKFSTDFSLMWFNNSALPIDLSLITATAGLNWKASKNFNFKNQLQFNTSTLKPYTANKNVLLTTGFDWKIQKKLTWQLTATANIYHFGSELPGSSLTPIYAGYPQYVESTLRTVLIYKF